MVSPGSGHPQWVYRTPKRACKEGGDVQRDTHSNKWKEGSKSTCHARHVMSKADDSLFSSTLSSLFKVTKVFICEMRNRRSNSLVDETTDIFNAVSLVLVGHQLMGVPS
jgi:hypothetical protein